MARLSRIIRVDVEYMPEILEPGKLYVSERFKLAIHLCACNSCKWQTVTPLSGEKSWELSEGPTLRPSIGNHQFPCRSHYYISNGNIEWM